MKKVYVVNIQFFGEWAYDCGANDIVGVYSTLESAIKKFSSVIVDELFEDEGRIISDDETKITDNIQDIKKIIEAAKIGVETQGQYFVNEYTNEYNYESGNDNAVIEIQEFILQN